MKRCTKTCIINGRVFTPGEMVELSPDVLAMHSCFEDIPQTVVTKAPIALGSGSVSESEAPASKPEPEPEPEPVKLKKGEKE